MRVLQVINTLAVAGAEALLVDVIRGLARRGVVSDVWALRRAGSHLERALDSEGVRVYGLSTRSVYSPGHVAPLFRHLRRHRYDLIHVHLFPAQLWAVVAAVISGTRTPLVTTEHSTYNRRRKWYFWLLDRWMYARYQRVICISEATRDAFAQWMPAIEGRIEVIWNGVSLERFRAAQGYRKVDVIGVDAPFILSVGRLQREKNMETLVRAVGALDGVHLAIVGEGADRATLEALIAKEGLLGRVHLLGRRSDIPQLLKTADVYVQSSLWEGFGIAAVEAMASGLPVVASRVPGLADVVGDAGLLVDPRDPKAFAEQIYNVITNGRMRQSLAERAIERAQMFGIDRTVSGILRVYERVVSRAFSPRPVAGENDSHRTEEDREVEPD